MVRGFTLARDRDGAGIDFNKKKSGVSLPTEWILLILYNRVVHGRQTWVQLELKLESNLDRVAR